MSRARPSAITGSAELNATIGRVAPHVLELLADGVPRTKAAVVAALAGRHAAEDVTLALIRLVVTERVVEAEGRYTPARVEPWPTGRPREDSTRRGRGQNEAKRVFRS